MVRDSMQYAWRTSPCPSFLPRISPDCIIRTQLEWDINGHHYRTLRFRIHCLLHIHPLVRDVSSSVRWNPICWILACFPHGGNPAHLGRKSYSFEQFYCKFRSNIPFWENSRMLWIMVLRRRALVRGACFIVGFIALVDFFYGVPGFIGLLKQRSIFGFFSTSYPSKKTLENLSLTERQCRTTFPGLMKKIDDAVARGPFILKEPDDYTGMVQLRIKDGKLSLLFNLSNPISKVAPVAEP